MTHGEGTGASSADAFGVHDKERMDRAGFGLLELLVAITIASIVLLGVGVAQSVCFELDKTSHETLTATADLEAAMEALLLLPLAEIPAADGPYASGQSIAAFEDLHLAGERMVTTYPNHTGAAVPDPLEIVLTLTFDDHAGRPRSLALAGLKTR